MVAASAGITAMAVLIRYLSDFLHPLEIVFFRNMLGLMFILPWAVRVGPSALKTERPWTHGLRSLFGLSAMTCWFWTLSLMPVADATAITFTAPLFAVIGAALVLGEHVGVRRWTAVLIGFAGMLIILRPGTEAMVPAAGLALSAALLMAAAKLTVKSLSRTEDPDTIVLYMGLWMTPVSLIPALFVWQWPTGPVLGGLVVVGLLASLAQRAMARSFACADASAVMPLDFSRLLFAAAFGLLLFGEIPDLWTWVGAGVIFTATVYTARREALIRRQPPGP